jgi:uncharacterized membrane protein
MLVDDAPAVSAQTPTIDDDHPPSVGDALLPRWVRFTGWGLLGLQLLAMLAFSTVQYSRYALTADFANYSQAWWAIAHGHLDPYSSGLGVSFWKDNAEFILWPLSLLYHVYPHPIDLLWVQDVAVVMTELVAFGWIRKAIERAHGPIPHRAAPLLAVAAAVVLVVNPWVYETIAFDFHFEPIAALFCVLVGYNLWVGRIRRLWWLVPLALICHVLAGFYLMGVGFSGLLAGPRTRRPGAAIAAIGLAWVFVFSAVGAAGVNGQFVTSSYGYLVGPHHGRIGLLDVVVGALGHPGSILHVAASHWTVVLAFLIAFGAIGVLSPWGLGMALVVLVPNTLDGSGLFVRYGAAFQSWPAMPFLLVGSVMVLLRLIGGGRRGRRVAAVAVAVWATLLGELAFVALPTIPKGWISVDPPAAAALARAETMIPPSAEVIASQGVIGRFSQRDSVYAFVEGHQTVPVNRRLVVFVLSPNEGVDDALPDHEATAAVGYVQTRLHAHLFVARSGVYAFAWSPSSLTTHVTLP